MTPIQIKNLLRSAVERDDPTLAWDAVKEIVSKDMYINVPTYKHNPKADPKIVTVQWGDKPCQGKCNELVSEGSEAWWVKGIGVWHTGCWNKINE